MTEAGWTREKAEKLCEAWFGAGARASWCPKMVDEFAAALDDSYQQGRVAGLREAANEMCYLIAQYGAGAHAINLFGEWLKEQTRPQPAQD